MKHLLLSISCLLLIAAPAWAAEEKKAEPAEVETEQLEDTAQEEAKAPEKTSAEEAPKDEGKPAPLEPMTQAEPKPENLENYKKPYGILTSENEGALGNRWWQGESAEFVVKAIRSLPETPQSETVRDLTRRLLLTKADPALLAPPADAETSIKLLQERLIKLVNMGLFDEVLKLYNELPQPVPDRLIEPVVQAMVGKNSVSQACIELKTNRSDTHDETLAFLKDLETYCGFTMRDGLTGKEAAQKFLTAKNITLTNFQTTDKASAASLLDFQAWLETGGAKSVATDIAYWKQLTPSLMLATLNRTDIVASEKSLQLLTAAKQLNMISAYAVGTHLKQITEQYFGGAQIPQSSDALDNVGKFLFLNAKINSVKDLDLKQGYAAKAIDSAYGSNEVLLFPFLMPIMDDSAPADFPAETAKKAIKTVESMAWLNVHEGWIKASGESYPEFNSYILGEIFRALEDESKLSGSPSASVKPTTYLSESIFVALDNVKKFRDSANLLNFPYEKYVDLTRETSYVMPSRSIFNALNQGVESKSFGTVVLSSLLIIGNKSVINLYPGLLHNVLTGFNDLGLTKEVEAMGEEALLALHKEGV